MWLEMRNGWVASRRVETELSERDTDGSRVIKHDDHRLIVQRVGKRVRLFTRNGHDRSERFSRIVEAVRRNATAPFVLDGGDAARRRRPLRLQRPAFPR